MTHTARYRPGRGPYFAQVPFALQDQVARYQEVPAQERQNLPTLDSFAISVYAAIRRHADFGEETGAAVSDSTVASYAGCSTTTVKKRREALRKVGWLEWESGKRAGEPNRYVVHASLGTEEEGGRRETPTPSSRDDYPGRRETTTTENHNTESQNTETSSDLRSSPGGPGEESEQQDLDPLTFYRETPTSEKPPTRHWNDGVAAFWRPGEERLQEQGGWPAVSRYLKRLATEYDADWREVSAFIVGSRVLVDDGEVGGVQPGEGFGYALPQDSEGWNGATWWSRARERFRARYETEEPDPEVASLVEEAVGV